MSEVEDRMASSGSFQDRVLVAYEYIKRYKKSMDGNSPTIREIAKGIGVGSTNTVQRYLGSMKELGLIERRGRKLCVIGGQWSCTCAEEKGDV